MTAQHCVECRPTDLRQLGDLSLRDADSDGGRNERGDRPGLLVGSRAGPRAVAPMDLQRVADLRFVHGPMVNHLTSPVHGSKVLYMNYRIITQANTRSKSRRTRTWTITAASADDAQDGRGDVPPDGRRYAACGDGVVAAVAEWIGLKRRIGCSHNN